MKYFSLFTVLTILFSGNLFAQIELPALFGDNMVLQQQFETPFWGWAEPGEDILIKGSWNDHKAQTIADKNGDWGLKLLTPKAGGPYFVTINTDTLHNVMIGEVWVCSGQSNMQWALDQSMNSKEEIPNASYPNIRFFYVSRQLSDEPQKDCHAFWSVCTPEKAKDFSAVAYYFGKQLHQEMNVPIGLIHTSWGGSSAQAWVSKEVLKSDPGFSIYYERQQEADKNARRGKLAINQTSPNCLYNAMIAPLIPYGIKGVIWYQGESNRDEAGLYEILFPALIKNWRESWGQGNFPFYFVQLAPFEYDTPIVGALLRDAQRKSLRVPNTGMAVTIDIGNPDDIHPTNKHDVGKRLALWALAKDYGRSELVYSGPLFKSMLSKNQKIRILFDYASGGLVSKDGNPSHFEIAGSDQKFYPARVKIEGKTIVLSSQNVNNPVAVRYAFHNADEPNLFNTAGLPASSFRTDDWPIITERAVISSSFDHTSESFLIKLQAADGHKVYYTLDGSEPDLQSNPYKNPFYINKSAIINTRVYFEGVASITTSSYTIIRHLATGKTASYKFIYSGSYDAGGNGALVNSIKGSERYNDGNWQGFNGKDFEIFIDLEEELIINSLTAGFLQDQGSWILFPEKIEYYGSQDGLKFDKLGEVVNEIPQSVKGVVIQDFTLDKISGKYRYIKVFASKLTLPEWHSGAGNDAWLFVDEISIK